MAQKDILDAQFHSPFIGLYCVMPTTPYDPNAKPFFFSLRPDSVCRIDQVLKAWKVLRFNIVTVYGLSVSMSSTLKRRG